MERGTRVGIFLKCLGVLSVIALVIIQAWQNQKINTRLKALESGDHLRWLMATGTSENSLTGLSLEALERLDLGELLGSRIFDGAEKGYYRHFAPKVLVKKGENVEERTYRKGTETFILWIHKGSNEDQVIGSFRYDTDYVSFGGGR